MLKAMIDMSVQTSNLPLAAERGPMATPKLIDEVFRSVRPSNSGVAFGVGLTPFAIVGEGHAEAHEVIKKIQAAAYTEQGGATSYADAQELVTSDVRFPCDYYVAGEKMCGWSLIVDLFHGAAHPVATSVRNLVSAIVPLFHQVAVGNSEPSTTGMDLISRIMYDVQQDYFTYVTQLGNGGAPVVPGFNNVVGLVKTHRVSQLATLPSHWYTMINAPRDSTAPGPARDERTSTRSNAGMTTVVNAKAEPELLERFRNSGHTTISAMLAGHNVDIPTRNNKSICLSWCLRGKCTTTCKRKTEHQQYSRDINNQVHELMTKCGVAGAPQN